jgi:hypothetical protein
MGYLIDDELLGEIRRLIRESKSPSRGGSTQRPNPKEPVGEDGSASEEFYAKLQGSFPTSGSTLTCKLWDPVAEAVYGDNITVYCASRMYGWGATTKSFAAPSLGPPAVSGCWPQLSANDDSLRVAIHEYDANSDPVYWLVSPQFTYSKAC